MAKRLDSFDVAKAIAIIAVIVGHTSLRYASYSSSATFAIAATFTFHLPVFFFIESDQQACQSPLDINMQLGNHQTIQRQEGGHHVSLIYLLDNQQLHQGPTTRSRIPQLHVFGMSPC